MKKVFIAGFFLVFGAGLMAQGPPPPPPDPSKGGTNGPIGAPIEGGLTIFLAFAAGCAALEGKKQVAKR